MAAVIPIMTGRRDLWAEAAATLSDKDRECLQVDKISKESISSSVLQMAEQKKVESDKKMWSFSFKGKKILVRDVLQSILSWTKKFEQVAEFVVGLDVSGHAAIPWSAIKFFIDVAGDDCQKYGAMLVGMDFVTREINFYTIFEVYYLKNPYDATEILSQSLIKTYAKLLGYLAKAKRYYSENPLKRALKAPFDDGGVDGMMTDVGTNRTLIEQNARLIDKQAIDAGFGSILAGQAELKKEVEKWAVPLEKISQQVTEVNDAAKRVKMKEILDWISLIQYEQHHERAKDGLLKDSGLWLFAHNDFTKWKGSPESSILWLQGIMGSGKTKLSALVAETLIHTADKNTDPVAYFYCMRDTAETERANPTEILKCIAQQLAYNSTTLAVRPAATKKYEELTEGGIRSKQLDLEESAKLIVDLTEGLASVTIIIDAMDECGENIPVLMDKLEWIFYQTKIRIRIFIASRNERAISVKLEGLPSSVIEMGANSGDIGLFVRTEVERAISQKSLLYGKISPESKQKIIETLTAGAQGMFRWASLQLESLKKLKNEGNLIKELSQLPPTLLGLYTKIYGQMSETDTFEIAVKALKLLACSQKPITTSAFLTAVSHPRQKVIDSESLLDYCFNLIVEDKALGIFRFAHLSVREYLETRDDYTPSDAHAVAAEICLACITKIRQGARDRTTSQIAEQAPDAMFEYATMFWPVHCGLSGEKRHVLPLAAPIRSFIMQKRVGNAFTRWMEEARTLAKSLGMGDPLARKLRHCFCSPPNPFFLACVFGLSEVVERSSVSITDSSESGLGGLHLASMYGHEKVVQILLGKGAGADSKDTYGRTPLFYAAENGHSKVVKVLLDHDKDIEISAEILATAASVSRRQVNQEENVLAILLSRDGEIQISPDVMWQAVTAPTKVFIESLWNLLEDIEISQALFDEAAAYQSIEVLDFLLDQNEPDTFQITATTLANLTNTSDTEALNFLLPFYPKLPIPEQVIIAAASSGGLEPLKVLVDHGTKTGFKIEISQNVFEAAARNALPGGIQLVEFLQGINANLQVTTKVIVSAARSENHQQALQMVQYFHAQNPEAEITDAVVKEAISSGNKDLLKYLLDKFKTLKVTRELFKIAAGSSNIPTMVDVLHAWNPEVQIDEEILEIAAVWADKEDIISLFERSKGCQATEKMILTAAKYGSPETVEFLFTKAPELQITDATIIAFIKGRDMSWGSTEVLQMFCDQVKDFKPTEDIAIAAAMSEEGREFLGYLIARYGSVPITDAVWKAATYSIENSTIQFLLDQDIKPRDIEGIIASTAVLGLVKEVKLLLSQAGKEIDSGKWLGVANLSEAIREGDVKRVQKLISKGVWLGAKHLELGYTPLSLAKGKELIKTLLQTGEFDLEKREEARESFLRRMPENGWIGTAKALLEAGADRKVADSENWTPEQLRIFDAWVEMFELLRHWEPQVAGETQL